jgi:hypothetical protein
LYPDLGELLNFSHPFQNNFRVADHSSKIIRSGKILVATWTTCGFYDGVPLRVAPAAMVNCETLVGFL